MKRPRFSVLLLLLFRLAPASTSMEEECTVGTDGEQVCVSRTNNKNANDATAGDGTATAASSSPNRNIVVAGTTAATDNEEAEDCRDQHEQCNFWAQAGECKNNPKYMLYNCPVSCQSCNIDKATEAEAYRELADRTELYGDRQAIPNELVANRTREVITYMTDTVFLNATYAKVKDECKNRHGQCIQWAVGGECTANPNYMTLNCAPSCFSCEQLDFDLRCPFDREAPKAFEKDGDVDRFFERLLEQSKDRYSPTLFSAPASAMEQRKAEGIVHVPEDAIADGPWVVTLENLLSAEECDRLVQLGYNEGYERSMDVGAKRFDGTFDAHENPRRTSTNAWCSGDCFDDPIVQDITNRLEQLTGIPSNHSEYWQLLRYEETQEYNEHHDFITYQVDRSEGVRILTVYFYLNDVEAGGGTRFPKLDLTVYPAKGRALIWPSTNNVNPDTKDPRTNHQALPVEKGIKYGANAWIHQRDYKTPHHENCQ